MWDKVLHINLENKTTYSIHYEEAFLKYVQNENCAKQPRLPITQPESILPNNLFSPLIASGSSQSSYDLYDLSDSDEKYLIHKNGARTTACQTKYTARLLTAARLYLNSPPELTQNWAQI